MALTMMDRSPHHHHQSPASLKSSSLSTRQRRKPSKPCRRFKIHSKRAARVTTLLIASLRASEPQLEVERALSLMDQEAHKEAHKDSEAHPVAHKDSEARQAVQEALKALVAHQAAPINLCIPHSNLSAAARKGSAVLLHRNHTHPAAARSNNPHRHSQAATITSSPNK